jgi:foldase protein PrsA
MLTRFLKPRHAAARPCVAHTQSANSLAPLSGERGSLFPTTATSRRAGQNFTILNSLFTILFAASFTAHAQVKTTNAADSLFPDPIVAKGKGFEIKRSFLDDAFIAYQAELTARAQTPAARQRIAAELSAQRTDLESNILQHLIINKIEVQKASDAEKTAVQEHVNQQIDDYRKSAPSEQAFQADLKAVGSTLEQVRARALEEQLGKAVLIRETITKDMISDAAIKKFYDDNPKEWVIPERVRIAEILISTVDPQTKQPLGEALKAAKQKLAREVDAKATNGGDFAALAKQYSDDITSKDRGGEYPPFAHGMIAPQLSAIESAAFTLQTNQVSDIVETGLGYHILKLLEKIPPSSVPLTNVITNIKTHIIDTEINQQLPAVVPKLETEYEVKTADLASPSATPALTPPTFPSSPINAPASTNK